MADTSNSTTTSIPTDEALGLDGLDAGREDLALDLPGGAPATLTAPLSGASVPDGGSPVGSAPAQHGLNAHSHGAGVPATNRAERRTSFDVADFPVPSGREEDWRFTPIERARDLFEPAGASVSGLRVEVSTADGVTHRRGSSDASAGKGFVPGDRAAAVAWADAASAGAVDVVDIAAEADLAEPVLVRVASDAPRSAGHLVVRAGAYSRATVVLDHSGSGHVGSGVEAVVGEGAHLVVVSVHQWEDDAVHLAQHDLLVGRDATVKHVVVTLGGSLVRVGSTVRYAGPGGDATLLGVYFSDAGQHLEHRSFVDHEAANCRSNVTYKGALQGETARAVWVGDVLIRASALGTDTYELNRNLVLTDGARADSVPNLEIETGEIVGAGHASATGRFDDEQLFYLQSRGIPEDQARRMVVRAFFADVLQQIGVRSITDQLMAAIEAELELADGSGDEGDLPVVADGVEAELAGARL
ncbi:Iron-regulated ABC transporter permease protein SufD [Quadrisphaera granulorum]|uniref:Iron-regulated ABC transporter permease protein SufD n=1 Tax=Quadrisphaera granulorum TaxID=317664 RepID=A0A315ZYB4_9ACTN|nr:Fe-S cluster assembly protein SufD [Quadrisphaera granulorum]PWJ50666.1 iron-regulated ABC transporter permease protein SufD [Quadrisphaera granulorum]SZE97914.1 Iron-regulated ABC transporter permease protein SufD [Quadrisphaera granulorum]